MRAQAPYKTLSMSEVTDYCGPPKYMSQRDAPLEIPIEIVKRLFTVMDQDIDDRVSLQELIAYVEISGAPIDRDTVCDMFDEAAKNRPVIHNAQKYMGLTIEEIQQAVRGRFAYIKQTKRWGVSYRSFRDYWILLFLTISERLFALQVPKVIPGKIVA